MYFALPKEYREATGNDLRERIIAAKERLGKRAIILTHHYQRVEVVEFGDAIGDSYALSQIAASQDDVEYIIFCGVHFMAEAAYVLAKKGQKVFLPNPLAGCPMADMAEMADVMEAWKTLEHFGGNERIMPISYMNSAAGLKAFVGEHGGLICTSSNADAAYKWGFERREKLFFFPDQHLGYNTGIKYGLKPEEMVIWDFSREEGGMTKEQLDNARVILWKGHCHVHTNFKEEHVHEVRQQYPGVKIVVHPECPHEVVRLADAVGSTSFIVNFVRKQPAGTPIAIGTEINLINRLALENPDKKIFELSGQACPVCANMYRTTLNDLAYCLENLDTMKQIKVPDRIRANTLLALQRMLEVH
ncbi:MAG: quinolinate synthase [candidate division Zixibacteria bacterium HGW-Zixibacteria-1]|nr:MAG: quinolinate synthase [candidate division Zixibacteria bacterium HGW-Zixibacteria-1]